MNALDPIGLTRALLALDTINPPGLERSCAHYLGGLLEAAGFAVRYHEFADRRTSLVAQVGGRTGAGPLVLTGHLDTVPLGSSAWTHDPFNGQSDGDRLYGRGSSDMKSGVAAMVAAACAMAPRLAGTAGLKLVLTAAEEGGCVGSRHLIAEPALLGDAGALLVGEPTANYPYLGHKGTVKFHMSFRGVAAHGSMPQLGDNAIYKAACAACELSQFRFPRDDGAGDIEHPVMGRPTLNVGTFRGGDTINSVPDSAVMGVDIRTVAGMDHAALVQRVQQAVGPQAVLDVFQDSNAVWTDPQQAWVAQVFERCAALLGQAPEPRTLSYNTDAGNFRRLWPAVPTIVLGPGDPEQAHQTDESCSLERIVQSVSLYEQIIRDWCGV